MIKAVILDFDGTLVDSVKSIWKEYKRVMEVMKLPKVTYREFTRHMGKPWNQVLRGMWPDVDITEFNRHYKVDAEKVSPIKEVARALSELKDDYLLAILTSRGQRTLERHMKSAEINPELFNVIMHRDNLCEHKPNPRALAETCRKLGVEKDEVLYVGDSIIDAECARNANVNFIGVLSGGASEKEFTDIGAKDVIKSIAELPILLRGKKEYH